MKRYADNNACPKCGASNNGLTVQVVNVDYHSEPVEESNNCAAEEHMHRTCGNCTYEWSEEPLTPSD